MLCRKFLLVNGCRKIEPFAICIFIEVLVIIDLIVIELTIGLGIVDIQRKGGILMLELHNVSWTLPNGRQVLRNVNLKVKENSLVAISGPNGSGKTTFAKILMGIEKPSSGEIFFNGKNITDMDVTERANLGISFGFQQPVSFKGITVRRMLSIATKKNIDEEKIKELLHKVGLCANDYIDRDIDSTLSGGEIKRIEIATVLARNSDFAIFDEPEAGIDLWSFEKLIHVFDEMRSDKKKTLVVISHQERILKIADEIVLIANGTVSDHGPRDVMLEKMMSRGNINTRKCGKMEAING